MCLRCVGCGRCIEGTTGLQGKAEQWDLEAILAAANEYGPHTGAVIRQITLEALDESITIKESLSILSLSDRFDKSEVERACEVALDVVASPRRGFIQAVLESGSYL